MGLKLIHVSKKGSNEMILNDMVKLTGIQPKLNKEAQTMGRFVRIYCTLWSICRDIFSLTFDSVIST